MFRNGLHFCLTPKHLENELSYLKHIKFYKIHQKIQEEKRSQLFEFLTVIVTLGPYNKAPT